MRSVRAAKAAIAVALAIAIAPSAADAKLEHRFAILAGGEVWVPRPGEPVDAANGHGFGILSYDLGGLPRDAHFVLQFNSDTLRLAYERARFANDKLELGAELKGEAFYAGLLPDYYRYGVQITDRGFDAHYVIGGGYLKYTDSPHYVELALGLRKWFFTPFSRPTKLVLPPEAYVGEARLRYTYWNIEGDVSLWEGQRLFPRITGLAFGFEFGLDVRSDARPWGARDPNSFVPIDLRNDPSLAIVTARQWLAAGFRLHARVRLQVQETALWMWGEDDLVRARVGGMNPWVVNVAGAPWASILAGRVASLHVTLPVRVWREFEVGPMIDAAVIDDYDRTGNPSRPNALFGAGAFADLRYKAWQFDARAGWSPTVSPADRGAFAFLASAGWGFNR